ncbi:MULTISPECIES: pentapeptide repeat-containing protein [Clostridium]|uniref:pentapeptide repeat-containing protein n=1 Tax=Clostridium TaxID=1485 RepID=UPI000E018B87|nr:pentapeptide repeat-containing protein [Clostridium sporogenes]MCW6085015.1 pentapeptide repeat-containing protein [Clostridium sporogenes]STC73579.1 putative low-complexity protein [Clostridium botulinum]
MIYENEDKFNKELRVDCKKCFGLCCIALYFSASEGFPINKDAGKPCINLQPDFTCSVHQNLRNKGLKGCTAYDCFGAGQKVAQVTYGGHNWRQAPESANQMFEAFLIMRQLHEMLWYLTQAFILQTDQGIQENISSLIENTERLTLLDVNSLLVLDIEAHRAKVNMILKNTSELVRSKTRNGKRESSGNRKANCRSLDYLGADLRKTNLRGADFRGACLIAANLRAVDLSGADLIGADLRDADISGANLRNGIFLTQAQINTAKGDSHTKLPKMITRPTYWTK